MKKIHVGGAHLPPSGDVLHRVVYFDKAVTLEDCYKRMDVTRRHRKRRRGLYFNRHYFASFFAFGIIALVNNCAINALRLSPFLSAIASSLTTVSADIKMLNRALSPAGV